MFPLPSSLFLSLFSLLPCPFPLCFVPCSLFCFPFSFSTFLVLFRFFRVTFAPFPFLLFSLSAYSVSPCQPDITTTHHAARFWDLCCPAQQSATACLNYNNDGCVGHVIACDHNKLKYKNTQVEVRKLKQT